MPFACHEYSYGVIFFDEEKQRWRTSRGPAETAQRWRDTMTACVTYNNSTSAANFVFVAEGR
eukprot:1297464-Pleurochrysis_carterae.AAC.1